MSIIIHGMEMPTARDTLVLVKTDGTAIVYKDEAYVTTAAPVPPHGRLKDADELKEWIQGWLEMNKYYHPHSKSNNIPIQEVYDIIGRLPTKA